MAEVTQEQIEEAEAQLLTGIKSTRHGETSVEFEDSAQRRKNIADAKRRLSGRKRTVAVFGKGL